MSFFKIEIKTIFYFACFVMMTVVVYTLQQYSSSASFPAAPHAPVHKVQILYSRFADSISNSTRQYLDLLKIKEKNSLLKLENQELKAKLQVQNEIQAENDRLSKLLELKNEHPDFVFQAAKVTAKDLFTDNFSLFINKGSADGIEKLSGVIAADGVVGYIIDVEKHSARILLANDRLTSIDATVQRTRSRGIATGYSSGECILKYIERPQDVTVGDLVVTSDDQQIFPPGYPVGTVTTVKVNATGVGHYAMLKPAIDLKKMEEVFILKKKSNAK
jgi:rod shape-determining protein MreC